MLIDWPAEFDAYLTRLEESTDPVDQQRLDLLFAQLKVLERLDQEPVDETPTLKRVRQSRRYAVWRVSHPYREGIAIRLIVWFADDSRVVVALFAGDKARMGDVFYDSVGTRADDAIDKWKYQIQSEEDRNG